MIRVALAGLAGRKLRAALTAIAIVLGVAMVSGTFVLTDSIDKAFDAIFTDVRKGTDAVVSGKAAFDVSRRQRRAPRRRSTSRCSRKVRALPDVAEAGGERRRRGAARSATTARRSSTAARRTSASASPTATRASTRSTLVAGLLAAGPTRSSSTRRPRARRTSQVGADDRRPGDAARCGSCGSPGSSSSAASRRIGGATLAGFDLPTAQRALRQGGQARRDRRRREARRLRPAAARARSSRVLPPTTQVKTGDAAGARRTRRTRTSFISFLQRLPARVRRDRALRRRVRDRELALDHDRPAHARVRDAADARRLAAAGARLDHRRGARRRHRSRRWSASSSASRSRRRSSRSSTPSASRCRTTASSRAADGRRRAARRRPRHAAREPPPGAARDARAADRRRPRGRDAAAVALRPLPHARLDRC